MKNLFCVVLIALMLCSLVACGGEEDKETDDNQTPNASVSQNQSMEKESVSASAASEPVQSAYCIDVDLTNLSSTMVYSEVYNMLYIGKTVKMNGAFAYYEDPETKEQYFACIIADAMACCSQGLDFIPTDEYTYPDDYPELNAEITVTGTFEIYEKNGIQYCRLANATIDS